MKLIELQNNIMSLDSKIHHQQLELDDLINLKDEIERKFQNLLDRKFENKIQYFSCYLKEAEFVFDINWITNNKEKINCYKITDNVLDYKICLFVSYTYELSKKDIKTINKYFRELKKYTKEFIEKELI